ncbi:FMN-binding protein [Streptomyces sp. NPDC050619]|uniref:FMN-binding protein n=1 Tax=Streptomyces sp. NPDC050619 TaxID=3157214 RepID=UPI003419B766
MRKSHPIRRVMLASAATVSGVVLLLSLKPSSDPASAAGGGAAAQPPAASAQGGAQAAGTRTVTGDATQTQYGAVQVRITVEGNKITKAEAVQAPKGGQSDEKTALSVPKLNQAVVTKQSAQIDSVSGATYTSDGYKKSLQSAIDKANASAGSGSGNAQAARTVTGSVSQTQYGPVQVRITVEGNKITKAEAVQAPKGGQSDEKTALSVPKLNQAVVTKQSPEIDSVSGATYTSDGYKKSLQSAIDKANASAGSGSGNAQAARTVTGSVSQTQYGPVQVRVTVSGGKVTKAEAVQAPKGGESDQKTALAVPKLNQQAVAAGSADIDSVSGATYTSDGYKKSLQSALDQAGG